MEIWHITLKPRNRSSRKEGELGSGGEREMYILTLNVVVRTLVMETTWKIWRTLCLWPAAGRGGSDLSLLWAISALTKEQPTWLFSWQETLCIFIMGSVPRSVCGFHLHLGILIKAVLLVPIPKLQMKVKAIWISAIWKAKKNPDP